ncbi:thiol:disulfide interchange protein [Erythrobacter litoralis HTCC2594]|uniref:Thiol:disulfide interchange protein n=2 Tax=Erythrobacter litoralis TaxID=39960 RepID=Q2N8S2_ERYLH|nr:thiol:disulfide interchange protein [Erythrobacter litoralis HTCC2594]
MFALLALLLAALAAVPAAAQGQNIRVALVAEGPVAPGGETTLAFKFAPVSEEWHGYWANPGDAGLPMQLEWDLPEGVSVGEPLYPTPKRLVIDGLMNHIFEGDYAVLLPLRLTEDYAGPDVLQVSVEAFYLACTDQICVPEDAQLQVSIPVGESTASGTEFAAFRSALAPLIDSTARFEQTASLLRLAIPLPAAVDPGEPHVFIANRDLVNYVQAQGFRRNGDWLIAEIPLARTGEQPETVEGIVRLGSGQGLRFVAEAGEVPSGDRVLMARDAELPSLWLLLGGALLGGLILNIMPCVFPILSLKALSLAKAGAGAQEARMEGLAYTAGVILACVALGGAMLALRAAGEQVGWAFQLQEPGVVVALLVLASLITANLLGFFELPGLSISEGSTPRGAFSTGLLAAFVATPCTGPFMAAALGAALLLPAETALLLFAVLGLGLALPFLLLGFIPAFRRLLPKPGAWMETFRKVLAVPMGLTALALVWLVWRIGGVGFALSAMSIAFIATLAAVLFRGRNQRLRGAVTALGAVLMAVGVLASFESPTRAQAETVLASKPFTLAALDEARASGAPVFVYFTADWCVSCKVNERVAIEREATREAFEQAGVTTLRGDWTLRQPEITEFLNAQGVAGVPLYLWYDPGVAEPRQLQQLLGPDSLVTLAREAGPRAARRPEGRVRPLPRQAQR